MDAIKPKLDDAYWFKYSETLTTGASEKRDLAAEKLQKLVLWLWGIFTTYATVGFALSEKSLNLTAVSIIVAASASLIAVYWGTVWVQMPIMTSYDPRIPEDISDAHSFIIKKKSQRLNFTIFLSVISACIVSLALFAASTVDSKKPDNTFYAEISRDNNKTFLILTAQISVTDKVIVKVDTVDSDHSNPEVFMIKPTADGLIQTSLEVEPTQNDLAVQLEWTNKDGVTTTITKTVAIAKQ